MAPSTSSFRVQEPGQYRPRTMQGSPNPYISHFSAIPHYTALTRCRAGSPFGAVMVA